MEDPHRQRITEMIKDLVEGTNSFDLVFNALREDGMFNDFMINEILSEEASKRLHVLYYYVTTRGPTAYRTLLKAFNRTNNGRLAAMLEEGCSSRLLTNGNSSNCLTLEEEFPQNEEWVVRKAEERFDFDTEEVYRMGSQLKGLALIINIRSFVNGINEERKGSEHDISRLKSILRQLNYEVILKEDLKGDEIRKALKEFAGDKRHEDCDSSIVFMMSHGRSNSNTHLSQTIDIEAYDGVVVNSQEVIEELMARRCPALQAKPKLFFFQACRGDNYNFPVCVGAQDHSTAPTDSRTDGMIQKPSSFVRSDSDILIGYSTSPGYAAMRDPESGSWYIQALCRVIAKHAWNKDIGTMLQIVDRVLSKKDDGGMRQTSTGADYFSKKFYFQPGMYD